MQTRFKPYKTLDEPYTREVIPDLAGLCLQQKCTLLSTVFENLFFRMIMLFQNNREV